MGSLVLDISIAAEPAPIKSSSLYTIAHSDRRRANEAILFGLFG
jgi:hypothetical protein